MRDYTWIITEDNLRPCRNQTLATSRLAPELAQSHEVVSKPGAPWPRQPDTNAPPCQPVARTNLSAQKPLRYIMAAAALGRGHRSGHFANSADAEPGASSSTDSADSSAEILSVAAIVGRRVIDSELQYKVRWAGYGPGDDTWEPLENLEGALDTVERFEVDRKAAEQPDAKTAA
eukprot:SAG22_NODE_8674_length_637_cov_1.544610_1_plen_174_part_10